MLLISVGLHIFLMTFPNPSKQKLDLAQTEKPSISELTSIPTVDLKAKPSVPSTTLSLPSINKNLLIPDQNPATEMRSRLQPSSTSDLEQKTETQVSTPKLPLKESKESIKIDPPQNKQDVISQTTPDRNADHNVDKSQDVASKAKTDFDVLLKQSTQSGAERISIPEFYFIYPELFYAKSDKEQNSYDIDKPHAGFDGNFAIILDQKPEQVFKTLFVPQLQSSNFEIMQMSNYGGGLVYKIKQSSFVRYLNLLPTQSGTGTIIVIWKSLPF